MRFSSVVVSAMAATMAAAHHNHDIKREQAMRRTLLEHTKKDLSHCAAKIRRNGLEARNVKRRAARAAAILEKKGSLKGGK
jgi:ABC-type bacteriocin/lantibiotic exporter with double-glycine peptidase domain